MFQGFQFLDDIMTYRQKNAYLSPNNRCLLISFAFDLMPATGLVVGEKLPLYVLMEQTIIRQAIQISWIFNVCLVHGSPAL